MNKKIIFLLMLTFCFKDLRAQGERFFRSILSGELTEKVAEGPEKKYHWIAKSSIYKVDITGNNHEEGIQVIKKDSEDWLRIYNHKRQPVFEARLEPNGTRSTLYKIKRVKVSADTKALLLYFYEGYTHHLEMLGTSRLYIITFNKADFSTFKLFKGPNIFEERSLPKEHYHIRKHKVKVVDLNSDGVNEILISLNNGKIVNTLIYMGNGKWQSPNRFAFDLGR